MKRIIATAVFAVAAFLTLNVHAQERLTVCVADPEGISSENAAEALAANLKQALVLNGAGADQSRFILKSTASVLSQYVTSTAPPMFVTELEVSLFITDTLSNEILSQTSFIVKGIAENDRTSYLDAVKKIKARSPKLRAFIIQAKEYFEEHIY